MASRPVSTQYLTAGADYLESLRSLGLNPNFLGWGWEIATQQWLLILVTSIIDAGGPLALNKLLFRAYNAQATPKEVSPFIVRVFSTEIIPGDFYMLGSKDLVINRRNGQRIEDVKVQNVQRTFLGIDLEMINSYQVLKNKKLKYHERRETWNRFKGNIEKLVA